MHLFMYSITTYFYYYCTTVKKWFLISDIPVTVNTDPEQIERKQPNAVAAILQRSPRPGKIPINYFVTQLIGS